MANPEQIQQILALAEERRRLAELKQGQQEQPEEDPRTMGDRAYDFVENTPVGIAQVLGLPVDIVNGVLSLAGFGHDQPAGGSKNIQSLLHKAGMSPAVGEESDTASGKAGRFVGAGAVPGLGIPATMGRGVTNQIIRQATHLPKGSQAIPSDAGVTRGLGEQMTRTALERPGSYMAAEVAGAGGTGAVSDAEFEGLPEELRPTAKLGTELVTGTAAALTAGGIPQMANRATRWGMENILAPFKSGAEMRAARQMQDRAADPRAAAEKALNAPEGVSPARATGEARLMAQEKRILDDDAVFEAEYRDALLSASRRAERELADFYGTPQGKQDWERTIIEQVSPPGTVIKPGFTDEMLDASYSSFDKMYGPIREYAMNLHLLQPSRRTPLKVMIENAPSTRMVMAGPKERKTVSDWLNNEYSGLSRRLGRRKGDATAGDLIDFRSRIRTEARGKGSSRKAQIEKKLLEVAESKVTQVLNSQLPKEARDELRRADRLYRQHKIVEDAVRRGGDKGLTPQSLTSAVRAAYPSGSYARGAGKELRRASQLGRPVSEVWIKPDEARIMARDMSPEQLKFKHAEFIEELMKRSTTQTGGLRGDKIKTTLQRNSDTVEALGIPPGDRERLMDIADRLAMIQKKSPSALVKLMDDGPATIFELLAVLQSAKAASQISKARGIGMGGGMVVAQYMNNRTRKMLTALTGDKAEQMIIDAHKDKKLYAALMTKNTDPVTKQKQSANVIQTYLMMSQAPVAEETLEEGIRELRNAAGN